MIPLSILDLAPIGDGQTIQDAIRASGSVAQVADQNGYYRYWLAEHHGMRGIASSATAVMLAQAGQMTEQIRIGSGGIMLPNHAPLMVAEQFGTLSAMFPNRVDLGLGRAPGTDSQTARALRRPTLNAVERYSEDIDLLQSYFRGNSSDGVLAIPGQGEGVPLWLLGSSLYSAQLAAQKGLPFAYASHFAPDFLSQAIPLYRSQFISSNQLDKPYAIAGVMAVLADTDQQAQALYSSARQQFVNIRRGENRPFPKPTSNLETMVHPEELMSADRALQFSIVGGEKTFTHQLLQFVKHAQVDELMITVPIHDVELRVKTIKKIGQLVSQLNQ